MSTTNGCARATLRAINIEGKKMTPEDFQSRRSFLAAQCPAIDVPEDRHAPIYVAHHGAVGPRVMFIHGGVQGTKAASATFDLQTGLADQGWRLEIVDRPGFGQSPSRGVDDQESDAAWIADMLADGAHLVGHSWGGAGALLAAARRPNAVRSLTLIEPALHALLADAPELYANTDAQADLA